MVLSALWGSLGLLLGALEDLLGVSWASLGCSWGLLGVSWAPLRDSWGPVGDDFGTSWKLLSGPVVTSLVHVFFDVVFSSLRRSLGRCRSP